MSISVGSVYRLVSQGFRIPYTIWEKKRDQIFSSLPQFDLGHFALQEDPLLFKKAFVGRQFWTTFQAKFLCALKRNGVLTFFQTLTQLLSVRVPTDNSLDISGDKPLSTMLRFTWPTETFPKLIDLTRVMTFSYSEGLGSACGVSRGGLLPIVHRILWPTQNLANKPRDWYFFLLKHHSRWVFKKGLQV